MKFITVYTTAQLNSLIFDYDSRGRPSGMGVYIIALFLKHYPIPIAPYNPMD